jgi:uncharacterized Rmd1/YagE family protein
LLPGYGPNANIRSSASKRPSDISDAEEVGYQGTYFTSPSKRPARRTSRDGYISSTSPVERRDVRPSSSSFPPDLEGPSNSIIPESETEVPLSHSEGLLFDYTDTEVDIHAVESAWEGAYHEAPPHVFKKEEDWDMAEAVFFEYGVVVFFGFEEGQELDILEDLENVGIMRRKLKEDDREIEECHFAVRLSIQV